ncbi:MAG: NACHT domain-containing protein [Cyanobacteria bacterium J06621_15]
MLELLLGWVTGKAAGLVFKTIFSEDFVKDLIKDYGKDFCKYLPGQLGNLAMKPFQQEPVQKAVAMALIEFLKLVQQQLKIRCKLNDGEIKAYTQDIKKFIGDKTVKENLGKAFDVDCEDLNADIFKQRWRNLQLKLLPLKFNWQSVVEQYLLTVQENISESEELRYIIELQKLTSIDKNIKEIAGVSKDFDLSKYQETIRERYVNLKLDSLDTDGSSYNRLGLWDVFIPQNAREVHQVLPELPREYLKRLQESNQLDAEVNLERIEAGLERYKSSYTEQSNRSILEIIQDKSQYSNKKYTVILGDPGSGKSTLLQYLALSWVENTLDKDALSQPIPLLIELRTYARDRTSGSCQDFLEFYHKSPNCICHLNQHKLEEQLKAGNALVMFDGLDEVFDSAQREEVVTAIHRFTNNYPRVGVIVTSRVVGYKAQRLRDAEFSHFMLQDLDTEQIKIFINKWHNKTFSSGDEVDKIRKRERLLRAIDNLSAIQDLAGNPLLLTMMAILNRNQELPRDRAELYNQASRVLLHQWDFERTLIQDKRLDPKTVDYKDKQAMLRSIAYFMQTNNKGLAGNLIQERDLQKILKDYLKTIEFEKPREAAKLMIEQLRTRNFMLCYLGADYYAFVHRTFLEYFCAWEFVWQFKETQTLTIEQLIAEVFDKHWVDESWHEVLRLIAGMIDAKFVGKIIQHLISIDGEENNFINLFIAADCLAEVRNRKAILSIDKQLLSELKRVFIK